MVVNKSSCSCCLWKVHSTTLKMSNKRLAKVVYEGRDIYSNGINLQVTLQRLDCQLLFNGA